MEPEKKSRNFFFILMSALILLIGLLIFFLISSGIFNSSTSNLPTGDFNSTIDNSSIGNSAGENNSLSNSTRLLPGNSNQLPTFPAGNNFCNTYYNGTVIDGFCYSDVAATMIESSAINGTLIYTPYKSEVTRTIKYPPSIEIKNNGLDFEIRIIFENKGSSPEQISLNNFKIKIYDFVDINSAESLVIQPGETKEVTLNVDLSNSASNWIPESSITFWDQYTNPDVNNTESHALPRILLYWDYDVNQDKPISVEKCGSRYFSDNTGICKDSVFYPSMAQRSCLSDNDCTSKYLLSEDYKCYEYSCISMGPDYIAYNQNGNYKIGILPLYVSDTDSGYNSMKSIVDVQLNKIIPQIDNWFVSEKSYWNTANTLGFNFFVEPDCRMSFPEFNSIHTQQGYTSEQELREMESKCISNKNYDFLIVSIQRSDYFDPSFTEAGINWGTIMSAQLNSRTLVHELLHSFGEHDIYGYESWQWGNCYLYNANTGSNWNNIMPHLCKFEAMQLGWFPKSPKN